MHIKLPIDALWNDSRLGLRWLAKKQLYICFANTVLCIVFSFSLSPSFSFLNTHSKISVPLLVVAVRLLRRELRQLSSYTRIECNFRYFFQTKNVVQLGGSLMTCVMLTTVSARACTYNSCVGLTTAAVTLAHLGPDECHATAVGDLPSLPMLSNDARTTIH